MPVVVRANPNRGGPDKTVRVLDVTTPDGEIHPFYGDIVERAAARAERAHPVSSTTRRREFGI
jgi:hypothetical protein